MFLPDEKAVLVSDPTVCYTVVETLFNPAHVRVRDGKGCVLSLPETDLLPAPNTEDPEIQDLLQVYDLDVTTLLWKIPQDLRGHKVHREPIIPTLIKRDPALEPLKEALRNAQLIDWVPVKAGTIATVCDNCGQDIEVFESDGLTVRVKEPCPNPQGVFPLVTELNVPSGKLVIANDLRKEFPYPDKASHYNTSFGSAEITKDYAEIGLAYGFIGNTDPSFKRVRGKKNSYRIATGPGLVKIHTSLWWYSICDADEFVRRGGNPTDHSVVAVKPGVYQITNMKYNYNTKEFATFDWIRPPDPVQDLDRKYNSMFVTPYDYAFDHFEFCAYRLEWGIQAWQEALDECLFTSSDETWHTKGFPLCGISHQEKQETMPLLRGCYPWYGSLKYSVIRKIASGELYANDDWVLACLNSLQCFISFGNTRQKDSALTDALDCFRLLAKRHPHLVDETYRRWVEDGDRADLWIQKLSRDEP